MSEKQNEYDRTYEECEDLYGEEGEYRGCGRDCVRFLFREQPDWSLTAQQDICTRILDQQLEGERFSDTLARLRSESPRHFEPEFNANFE
jgi:hypothetical protein